MQFAFVTLALACFAVANPNRRTDTSPCNTGSLQCCKTTENSKSLSTKTKNLLGGLGVILNDLTAEVGLTCNPITVIGVGSTACTSQTVCCNNNNFDGLVALGCTPINVNI